MQATRQKLGNILFWVGTPVLVVVTLLLPLPQRASASQERFFQVKASRFAYQPATFKVNRGDRVTIELEAEDVIHGLAIDGYNLEISADPGQPARLSFIADHPGTFRLRCSVTCGPMHPFMLGKLQVGTDNLFFRGAVLALLLAFAGLWRLRR